MMQQRIVKHDLHVSNQIEEGVWFWSRKQYFFSITVTLATMLNWTHVLYQILIHSTCDEWFLEKKSKVSTLSALSLCQMHQLPKQNGGDLEAEK